MDGGIVLIILIVLGVPLAVAIWLIVRAVTASNDIRNLSSRVNELEYELMRLRKERETAPEAQPAKSAAAEVAATLEATKPVVVPPPPPIPEPAAPKPPVYVAPPPLVPEPIAPVIEPALEPEPALQESATPPPIPEMVQPARAPSPGINWEQFMGVKLFAWVGGLALFLGVAFFVKYSFDNNLISAEMRVAIGYFVGIALLVGGVVISRKNYLVLAQTLCATGVVILYAITFAARAYYHFLDTLPAFGVMVLITATGFLLAVRLNALVVAILGMLGGFLTPILLSTGVDNPGGLFGYIAILDVGLIVVALTRRWYFLTALAALCTALMQIAWASEFFVKEKYFEGDKILIPMAILAGFNALYLIAAWWTKRRGRTDRWLSGSALGLAAVALGFTFAFLSFEPLALQPWLIFGFVFLINLGVIALVLLDNVVAFAQLLAAICTALLQMAWAVEIFVKGKYFEGNRILIPMAILAGFNALYLVVAWWVKRRGQTDRWVSISALGLAAVALGFTFAFLGFERLAHRPWLIFGFVFLIDLGVIALVLLDNAVAIAQPIAGMAVFGLLTVWTANSLNNSMLNAALAFYFIFAVLHTVFPLVLKKKGGVATIVSGAQIFPPIALVLVLIPIFRLPELSLFVWPFVLLVDILAIGLAVLTASLLPVVVVLLLTLGATGGLIFKIPEDLTGLPSSFFVLGAFAVFFFVVSVWLIRKYSPDVFKTGLKFGEDLSNPADVAALLPACSVILPFLLLIMATLRLPLTNPSPVFGLALLLVVLLLGVTKLLSLDWMPLIGLICVMALECAWHFDHFERTLGLINPPLSLMWYLIFFAIFAVFPFLFLRKFSEKIVPWVAAALAGPAQFFLIYRLVKLAYPNQVMGLLPAAFALPGLLSLVIILKRVPAESRARMSQLAVFGGVALFFITLIFPIQFENQWITIGWALEGAALLWLFHRVPHPGLRIVGFGLLVAAFVRLSVNPYVLSYHTRAATPIFNWYLYAYGIVTVCLFVGAALLARPRNKMSGMNVPPILYTLGTVLAFLLLNIEIADYFSDPGSTLTFEFSGNFARDMTYSIAWALFALVLLIVGIWRKVPGARYSALGLLSVTILKLFFHDLARLNQLYRVGALIGVSVIAFLAVFAYSRFFATVAKKEPQNETPPA
jgi:hypothetical protein